jgi:hypothetical protein
VRVVDREGIRRGREPQLNPPVRKSVTETLVRDATISQRSEIDRAISENAAGVEQLATRILNDPEIQNPIACFLSKLRNGAHLTQRARTDGRSITSTEDWQRWDPALAEASAQHAQELLAKLGHPPASVVARAKALMSDDDDIPGYGDTP